MARSYYRNLLIRFLLLVGIPALLFPAFFLIDGYREGAKQLQKLARQVHMSLVQTSKEGFLTQQVDQYLLPLARSALLNPEITGVVFRSASGKTLLCKAKGDESLRRAMQRVSVPGHTRSEGLMRLEGRKVFYMAGPVTTWRLAGAEQLFGLEAKRTEQTVGSVVVFADYENLQRRLRNGLLQSGVAVALVLLVAGLAALSMARRLGRPVEELIESFRALEQKDFTREIADPEDKELLLLVNQFRRSRKRLKDLIKEKDSYSDQLLATAQELEDLNANLERTVAERTQSLKNANEMLELTNRKIQEADRLKSEFLANMSHELRTPLNAVIGFSELLIEEVPGPITSAQKQCLQDVLHGGQHLLRLINEILDLSKVEAGKMPMNFTTKSVEAILSDLGSMFAALLAKKNQELVLDCSNPEATVYTDQEKLGQVLINLVSNAHKFSPEGSSIEVTVTQEETHHLFRVADEGIGIPEDQQQAVFEAFRQVDGTMSRSEEGTGLGLTLCKRFTELMGGVLTLESRVGKGTTFSLLLPLEPTEALEDSGGTLEPDGQSAGS